MIDYTKRRAATPPPPPPVAIKAPPAVRRALEIYELCDRKVAEAKANNADPTRKAVKVPFYERSDAAKALALVVRQWIG
jgi:hypothetical protein